MKGYSFSSSRRAPKKRGEKVYLGYRYQARPRAEAAMVGTS